MPCMLLNNRYILFWSLSVRYLKSEAVSVYDFMSVLCIRCDSTPLWMPNDISCSLAANLSKIIFEEGVWFKVEPSLNLYLYSPWFDKYILWACLNKAGCVYMSSYSWPTGNWTVLNNDFRYILSQGEPDIRSVINNWAISCGLSTISSLFFL